MDITVDRKNVTVPAEMVTWGDVLDSIEAVCLGAGQCITRVYLGGSEAFDYRDPLVRERKLADIGAIIVHSGDFGKVVRESLGELGQELKDALKSNGEIVRLLEHRLENRNEEEAYNLLTQLLDSIRIFFTIFSEDLGWVEPADAEISRKEVPAVLNRAVTQLISAQQDCHWVSICDVLEYEVAPILESWQKIVEETTAHIS